MYFTSEMQDLMETTEQSACLRFARDFMPIVNNALAQVYAEQPAAAQAEAAIDAPTSVVPAEAVSSTPGAVGQAEATDGVFQALPGAAAPAAETGAAETTPPPEAEK
jgi:hypothetical protein